MKVDDENKPLLCDCQEVAGARFHPVVDAQQKSGWSTTKRHVDTAPLVTMLGLVHDDKQRRDVCAVRCVNACP